MSLWGKVEGFFSDLGSVPADIWKAIQAGWNALRTVWSWIVSSYGILGDAWTWVVNGASWLFGQVGDWAAEVYAVLEQTLEHTIPDAIAWVFDQAVHWAASVIAKVYRELRSWVDSIYKYVVKLIHDLVNELKAALHDLIKWVTGPVRWVLHWGSWIINLLTHPEHLADWIAHAILKPVAEWLLKEGATLIVWVLRKIAHDGTEFAHLIEDVLHDLL